jgi:6-phosphogluconate dehydrogenase
LPNEPTADIAVIGLAVMGQNLILNMNDRGYRVVAYNRTTSKVDSFLVHEANGTSVSGAHSIADMVAQLKRPRKVMLMVKAGAAVDEFIEQLNPHLEPGDVIIDGGNTHFPDSIRRAKDLEAAGVLYVGTGVSGGEEGARNGPSMMPGGSPAAWPLIKDIFQAICARTPQGDPCCDWMGEDGAGHYVKMVHNGIEYGDMQLIAEAYWLMKQGLGMTNGAIQQVFADWNTGELDSYLIEITADILTHHQPDGTPTVDIILDAAGQKGTGKWTATNALDLGTPVTLIGEAVFARALSSMKDERVAAAAAYPTREPALQCTPEDIRQALFASKIISYAQGFMLLREAAREYKWNLNYGGIALVWRGGCIIRSAFLGNIKEAYDANPALPNLLLAPHFSQTLLRCENSWRQVVAQAALAGIPTPAFMTALSFFDGYRSAHLPANLIQAQRDYFGAHTYERTDRPRGEFEHTNWTGHGGNVSSTTYNA